jgi:plastocyanin
MCCTRVETGLLIATLALATGACLKPVSDPPLNPHDAAPNDAVLGAVRTVDCANAPAAPIVRTANDKFDPRNTSIAVGQVVKFVTNNGHNAVGDTAPFTIPFDTTACLQFSMPGNYAFHCVPHGFTGTIVVAAN